MMKLGDLTEQKLKWVQPNIFKANYELHVENKIAATLSYPRYFGTSATAKSADGIWAFKGGGFGQPNITIRTAGKQTELAVFKRDIWAGGGILRLPNGQNYQINITDYRPNGYDVITDTGDLLVSYKKIWRSIVMYTEVQIHRRAKNLADMPLTVLLGWHLILVAML